MFSFFLWQKAVSKDEDSDEESEEESDEEEKVRV